MRFTDRARRTLRRARFLLGVLAVAVAVPVGVAAAGAIPAPLAGGAMVRAELLAAAPVNPSTAVVGAEVPTPARWSTPDGGVRTGLVWVEAGLAPGATVTVPVDAFGSAAAPKVRAEDPGVTGVLAGIATVLVCWTLLAIAAAAYRIRLDAIDDHSWAAGWAHFEPIWSGRKIP